MSELALKLIAENKKTQAPFLDLGNCGLVNYLPNELFDCVWLKRLNLGRYYYDKTSEDWTHTKNSIGGNVFGGRELIGLEKLANLQSLDLSLNQISDFRFLEKLTGLQSLNLSDNQTSNYSFLEKLTGLQSLYLRSCNILDIRFLEKQTRLQALYLSDNEISDIRFLENLTGLQLLDLRYNEISDISFLEKLTELQSLYLSHNQISDISVLEKLTRLHSLHLHSNQISDISVLEKLTELQSLYLHSNQISDISVLEKLTRLHTLYLHSNQISDIGFLGKLTGLQSLDLHSNQISDIRFLEKLTGLQSLDLHSNQISDIRFLEKLTDLLSLDLSSNKISDIHFLKKLTDLQSLDLHSNKISDIRSLEKLTDLQSLDLCSNQISDIAFLLPLLQRGLRIVIENDYLNILNNEIYLKNNPISNPPLEIVKQGREAVIEYFEGKRKPLNECKLIFVGDGGVGKTSLMRRVVYNTFDKNEITTHGINKIAWEEIRNVNNEKIKVNLWDFGGQHIQHSLHQFFFTKRVVYVLVLDPRNDLKANYWLDQIEKLGCDSEVLIVYNWKQIKDKQGDFVNNFYELRKKYPKLPEPFILSCETGEGVQAFKKRLIESILKNESLRDEYLVKWFNIKQRLEKEVSVGKNYINYETYQTWCGEEDYKEPERQKDLLEILNRIGSIVFYNKPKLEDWQVLNPEWITTGAYSILISEQNRINKGHLSWQDLKAIFKEAKEVFSDRTVRIIYTENQFQFIIDLMLEYDLCQRNPFQQHEYLIPSAFGEKPDKSYDFAKDDARAYRLQFESPFEMLIIHRFIAKNLVKIINKDYWQSGIFIKHPTSKTYALVETNLYSKRIDCWIKGENIRGFWEIIRADFREILSIYHNFKYSEEVEYQKDGQSVFLPYQQMLNAYADGIRVIEYDKETRLRNIDVLIVLDLFESRESSIGNVRRVPVVKTENNDDKEESILPEIFFSYAWDKAGEIESREALVKDLYESLKSDGYEVRRDKEDLKYGESISKFMQDIGEASFIIIALSDAYLKSENTMYELYEMFRNSRLNRNELIKRIYPIRVESVNLSKPESIKKYFIYWQERCSEWRDLVSIVTRPNTPQHAQLDKIERITSELGELLSLLGDVNADKKEELSKDNFAKIKKAIENRTKQ